MEVLRSRCQISAHLQPGHVCELKSVTLMSCVWVRVPHQHLLCGGLCHERSSRSGPQALFMSSAVCSAVCSAVPPTSLSLSLPPTLPFSTSCPACFYESLGFFISPSSQPHQRLLSVFSSPS